MNLTGNHEFECSIPVLAQWVKDPALLWLWCRLVASASITPLDWEPAHASHVALERQKDKKQTNKQKKPKNLGVPIMVQWLMNPTRNHEFAGSIPGLAQWVMDLALL